MAFKYIDLNNRITSYETLRSVIYGGRGVITLAAPSGNSHDYAYSRPRSATSFPDDVVFVYALHDDKKFYLGMVEKGRFRVTQNSRFTEDTEIVRGAEYIMKLISDDRLAKTPMTLVHGSRCCKCGRPLNSKFGQEHGCGKSCYRKLMKRLDDVGV